MAITYGGDMPKENTPTQTADGIAWAPIVAAGISAVGSWLASKQAKKAQEKANQQNMELARYQNQANVDMWNMQNAYNTPAAQMARYAAAGLSPNLIYGQGNAGNASSAPSVERATVQAAVGGVPQLSGMLEQMQNFEMRQAQIDNVKASTASTQQETLNKQFMKWILEFRAKSGEVGLEKQMLDLQQAKLLAPYNLDAQKNLVSKGRVDIQAAIQGMKLRDQEEVLNQLKIQGGGLENKLKKEELIYKQLINTWGKRGITPQDNVFFRMLSKFISDNNINIIPDLDDQKMYMPWDGLR